MNIIVTGASRGIGFEIVKAFSREKESTIIAISRNKERLKNLKTECLSLNSGSNIFPLSFDLEKDSVKSVIKEDISQYFSTVDILINNAGVLINKPFENLSDKDFDKLFDVNVKSIFRLVQALLPMFKSNSHIINISSMGGFQGSAKFPGLSLYSASKGALAVLSECMAEEFTDRQIKVNSLALGAVQTEMLEQAFPGYKAPVSPVEMAKFIKDFAINGHKFFNGKVLPVSLSKP